MFHKAVENLYTVFEMANSSSPFLSTLGVFYNLACKTPSFQSITHQNIMGDISAMDAGTLAKIASSLTPEQIAQTQWNIENTGRITMHDFEVSELEHSALVAY